MSTARTKLNEVQLEKKMGEFYLALGAFNKSAVSKILSSNDSDVWDKVIQDILDAGCEIHDQECPAGFFYDHSLNACVRIKGVIEDDM